MEGKIIQIEIGANCKMQKGNQMLAEAAEAESAQQLTLSLAVYLPLELLQAGLVERGGAPCGRRGCLSGSAPRGGGAAIPVGRETRGLLASAQPATAAACWRRPTPSPGRAASSPLPGCKV